MKYTVFILLFLISVSIFAQQNDASANRKARKLLRDGNELYQQKKYGDAEVAYKKALEKNATYDKAIYNLGNALYQENRGKESIPLFETIAKNTKDKLKKAEAFHNLGNSNLQTKDYGAAVEAYKNSLRINPKDDETRYNLALAQKLLKEQQKNKDKQKNKDDKNQQNKDNKDQNKDKKDDKDKQKDKKDDPKNKDDKKDQKDKDKQQQPQPNKLSQQQVQQLLDAMNNEENKTQKKVNAQKVTTSNNKKEKDW